MKKAALVIGGTLAGVTGVLALNPSAPDLLQAQSANESTALGSAGDSSVQTPELSAGSPAEPSSDDDEDVSDSAESDSSDDSDEPGSTESPQVGTTDKGNTGTSSSGSKGFRDGSYLGATAQTRWGPVQVRVTVDGGRITAAEAVQLPDGDHHSAQISEYTAPMLEKQAISANSAKISGVSGATYTSYGFAQSLQSALSKARA